MISKEVSVMFIGKTKTNKLWIFGLFTKKNILSVDDIQEKFELSSRNLKQVISGLNKDIKLFDKQMSIEFRQGCLLIPSNPDVREILTLYTKLKYEYAKESPTLNLAGKLLEIKTSSVYSLSKNLNYSMSHCYKLIEQTNCLFSSLELDITMTIKDKRVSVEGDLLDIVLFRYYSLLVSGKRIENIELHEIIKSKMNLSRSNSYKLELLTLIFLDSANKYKINRVLSEEILYTGERMKEHNSNFWVLGIQNLDSKKESAYYFLLLYTMPYIFTSSTKIRIGKIIKEDRGRIELIQSVVNIIDSLEEFQYSDDEYYLMIFELVTKVGMLRLLNFRRFRGNISDSPLLKSDIFLSEALRREIQGYFKKAEWNFAEEHIFHHIISKTSMFKKNPIKIYIELIKEALYTDTIKEMLRRIYTPEFLIFTDNIDDSDIIIADSVYLDTKLEIPIVVIRDIHDKSNWLRVSECIHNKSLDML